MIGSALTEKGNRMTDYIKKADAYKIALHDGSDIAAQKIADLKPDNDMYEIDTALTDRC